jgi:hypothetical protein
MFFCGISREVASSISLWVSAASSLLNPSFNCLVFH